MTALQWSYTCSKLARSVKPYCACMEEPMTTIDFITALFYQVDEQMRAMPKHPDAHLWPSERP